MAMQRVMSFPPTPTGRGDFRLLYEAFRGRDPEKISKEDRARAAEVQSALEAISDPLGELPESAEFDIRLRKLSAAGGDISISQRAHEMLVSWIDEAKFMSGLSVQAMGLRDRLGAAASVDTVS